MDQDSTGPAHYKSLALQNFRGFKSTKDIPLAPLTFLVGPNSSGKSSICDAILLLTQSNVLLTGEPSLVPRWEGPLVDLGAFEDAVFKHDTSLSMTVAVEISLEAEQLDTAAIRSSRQPIRYEFRFRSTKDNPVGYLKSFEVSDHLSSERMSVDYFPGPSPHLKVKYFSKRSHDRKSSDIAKILAEVAHKIEKTGGPRGRKSAWRRIMRYVRSDDQFRAFIDGTQRVSSGRAAPQRWFSRTAPDELVPNSVRKIFNGVYPVMIESTNGNEDEAHHKSKLAGVLKQLDIASAVSASHLSPYHSTVKVKDSETRVTSNLIDVGYGASQVIPVITACLTESVGPLFVEQPEIHLHPKAQGIVAELLCETSLRRQVIVETHSVHMINRARLQVAKKLLDPDKVMIVYVDRNQRGSHIYTIPIKENGDFGASWRGGFFDERYEDTMALLQLKSQE